MKRSPVQMLVEAGIMIGLAYVLNLFKIYQLPQGGSVTAGSMIPILVFALRWGVKPGLMAGLAFGLLQMAMGGYVIHPAQAALDYPLAFAALGLAGLFSKQVVNNVNTDATKAIVNAVIGVSLAVIVRFVCHVLSGVIFFSEYAGEMNPWLYSGIYNGSFLSVELILSAVLIAFVTVPVMKAVKPVAQ